jgi:ATP-dependent DNA ligase
MLSRRPAACREAAYELKWDGFRGVRGGPRTRSSSGPAEESISAGDFPTSSRPRQLQVPVGTVLDGEVCVWLEGRLDWGQLQRRLGSARQIAEQARTPPASYVAFDLLSVDGFDVRTRPWTARRSLRAIRRRPAAAAAGDAGDLRPGRGEHWSRDYRPMGIEGLVIKGAATRYVPGRDSSWLKWKTRETEEVILGAVTGTFDRPEAVIAGRLTTDGQLVLVGRSTPLTAAQAEQLAAVLTPMDSSRRPGCVASGETACQSPAADLPDQSSGSPFLGLEKLTGSTAAVQAHADPASSSRRSGRTRRAISSAVSSTCSPPSTERPC